MPILMRSASSAIRGVVPSTTENAVQNVECFILDRIRCFTGTSRLLGWRYRWLLELPPPDQQPNWEDQFHKGRNKKESERCAGIKVWLQANDYPTQSIVDEQNPNDPRNVLTAINHVAQQDKMNPKNHQTQ